MGDKLKELSLKNTPNAITEFSILYKGISRTMNITTKRIETEVELFSQLYSVGITSFEKFLITQYTFILKLEEFADGNMTQLPIQINSILSEYVASKETLKVNFKQLPNQIDSAVSEYINLRKTLKNTPTHNFSFFKEAKNQLVEVLSFLIHEFQDAKELTTRILEKL
ncbi:hypothetical protein [Chryseobacterium geocarposphaerae]|uniref:Uncharacterized protein n=1 Tax=Chryseobacterium geocarposphaerae TaxID=1416776 RepID=A0A2M9C8X0_9FLAO|nr:hypothetical protein [Chryseobacterium geocarposphaerae]PJJ67234.1 hypothetical protein CLV73_1236 [Chryseobacterium geocarposphaerae]